MLSVRHCSLFHGTRPLLSDISFDVAAGEIMTLMGPSGAGKSTFLNWMIGALPAAFTAKGEIWLNGQRRDALPIEQRRIGILFQDALLFPHLNVGQNLQIAIPAIFKGKQPRRELAEQALADAGLKGFASRDPATLSGGERARISVLRALLAQPEALLLDEPYSRLDQALRAQFRDFVRDITVQRSLPVVLVTHDPQDSPPGGKIITL